MKISIRKAEVQDVATAVPLIYSSGPDAFEYIFSDSRKGSACEFLSYAFLRKGGEMGFDNHFVIDLDGAIAGIGACWSGRKGLSFAVVIGWKILRFYGLIRGISVILRGLRFERMVKPPSKNEFVVAHLGVREDLQGKGLGSRLIHQLIINSRAKLPAKYVLDVSDINHRACALYERLGFKVTGHIDSGLERTLNPDLLIKVPGHSRMQLVIRKKDSQ